MTEISRTCRPAVAILIAATLAAATACAGSTTSSGTPAATSSGSASSAASATPAASPRPSATPRATPVADVAVRTVVDDLVAPVGLVPLPGDATRALVLDQTGLVSLLHLDDGTLATFLDLRDRVVPLMPDYDERGLLGLAFHPDFAANGRLFVYYGAPLRDGAPAGQDHTNTLSEFHADPADPSRADPASERVILRFEQPQHNHSGGALGFGPDGMLYLGTGDGGGQGDASEGHSEQGNAQDLSRLNGKILRLDVDGKEPYAIPADNPSLGGEARAEIFAYGFRNPWRLAWEPAGERRLIVSDVGYGRFEEIDVVVSGGNYGWRIREGAHCLDVDAPLTEPTSCATTGADGKPLIDPVVEYTHRSVGVAVVGGYVYRGSAIPALRGRYVFADFSADPTNDLSRPLGSLLVATPGPDGTPWEWGRLTVGGGPLNRFVTGMGEDGQGELYVLTRTNIGPTGTTGEVLRLVAPGP
ncbi:MAG TPA: PQQ-dependent sugar dehydrogenase [Candidatus Limnocylindrales bacterium]